MLYFHSYQQEFLGMPHNTKQLSSFNMKFSIGTLQPLKILLCRQRWALYGMLGLKYYLGCINFIYTVYLALKSNLNIFFIFKVVRYTGVYNLFPIWNINWQILLLDFFFLFSGLLPKEKPPLNVVGDVGGRIAIIVVSSYLCPWPKGRGTYCFWCRSRRRHELVGWF